jgi:hypothetical protein
VENAWVFATRADFEMASMEIDLATGAVHNGYIAAAYALGVPAVMFFLIGCFRQIYISAREAIRSRKRDRGLSDLHKFVCANLVALLPAIFVGTDLNGPVIWYYLTLGVLLMRLGAVKGAATVPQPIEPRPLGGEAMPPVPAVVRRPAL